MSVNESESSSSNVQDQASISLGLGMIPKFDGNPADLNRFIESSETLLTYMFDPSQTRNFRNIIISNGILNKLEGEAKSIINIYGSRSWLEVKETLIANFGDQRDESSLTRDLVNLKQNHNEKPQDFYKRCIELLNIISNYINLHTKTTELDSKKTFYQQQTLKSFLAGLREPLGSTIRAMRPGTLATAIQYIQEEQNIQYLQKTHITQQDTRHPNQFNKQKQWNSFAKIQNYGQPLSQDNYYKYPKPFQTPPHPQFQTKDKIHYAHAPYQQQHRPVHNYNNNSQNAWKQQKPVPMSGISYRSRNGAYKQNIPHNHFANRKDDQVACEELFNNEVGNDDDEPNMHPEQEQYFNEDREHDNYEQGLNEGTNTNFHLDRDEPDTT